MNPLIFEQVEEGRAIKAKVKRLNFDSLSRSQKKRVKNRVGDLRFRQGLPVGPRDPENEEQRKQRKRAEFIQSLKEKAEFCITYLIIPIAVAIPVTFFVFAVAEHFGYLS